MESGVKDRDSDSGNVAAATSSDNPHKGKTGWQRVSNAFFYSLAGLGAAYKHEDAFRQEVLLAVVLIPAVFFLPASGAGRALMVGAVLLVLIVELLNSAVEAAVDRISLENHELAKRAKDIGSAAVMLALINVPVVWLLVLTG
jgi:diacylglycerol kinase (ATP)